METAQTEKKSKALKPSAYASLRVKKETRKKAMSDLAKANKKDFGRRVRMDEYVSLALSLVTPEHLVSLQESSLTNKDRFEREYRDYVTQHGPIQKDAYLGKRLRGEIQASTSSKAESELSQKIA